MTEAHRERVGGMWDELGRLQIDFLRGQGLASGRHAARRRAAAACAAACTSSPSWSPGRYYGVDRDAELIRAGLEIELPRAGLAGRADARITCS